MPPQTLKPDSEAVGPCILGMISDMNLWSEEFKYYRHRVCRFLDLLECGKDTSLSRFRNGEANIVCCIFRDEARTNKDSEGG